MDTPSSPQGSTSADLKAHAAKVARQLDLNQNQTRLLVSEVRNALSPVVMALGNLSGPKEDLSDIEVSVKRLLAIMNALT
jgi:hypothetical protein